MSYLVVFNDVASPDTRAIVTEISGALNKDNLREIMETCEDTPSVAVHSVYSINDITCAIISYTGIDNTGANREYVGTLHVYKTAIPCEDWHTM